MQFPWGYPREQIPKMFVLGLSWTIDSQQQNYLHSYAGISILDLTDDPKTRYTIKDIFYYMITKREIQEDKPEYTAHYLGHKNENDSEKKQYIKTFTRAVGGTIKCAYDLAEMYELKGDKSEAIRWYKIAAEENLPEAQYKLANMYSQGNLVNKDIGEAAKWFKIFSEHKLGIDSSTLKKIEFAKTFVNAFEGDAIAQYKLGLLFKNRNTKEAIYWLELSAKQKFHMALYELANIYETDQSKEQNPIAYYFIAARNGNARANYKLAKIYENRSAANPEDQENRIYAMNLLKKAAKSGILEAQYELATIYLAKKDDEEAVKWFKKLSKKRFLDEFEIPSYVQFAKTFVKAREGSASEQCRLGIMYKSGIGIKKDDQEALRWFSLSAEQNCMTAQYYLGSLFEEGRIVDKDMSQALFYYQEAARLGEIEAQLKVAALSEERQDIEKALIFYLTAATSGCAEAQYHVARLLLDNGNGTQNVEKEAFHWLMLAVNNGYLPALTKLGELFLDGRIVKKDIKQGFDCLWAAAKRSDPQAQFIIGCYYQEGLEGALGINRKAAYEFYRLAAEQGNPLAQNNIGCLLERGWGIPPNLKKAALYYKTSYKKGCLFGQSNYGRMLALGKGIKQNKQKGAKLFADALEKSPSIKSILEKEILKEELQAMYNLMIST